MSCNSLVLHDDVVKGKLKTKTNKMDIQKMIKKTTSFVPLIFDH